MITIRHNRFTKMTKSLRDVDVQAFLNQPLIPPKLRILPDTIGSVLKSVAGKNGLTPDEVMGKQRTLAVVKARNDFVRTMHFKHQYSAYELAHMMNMDVTSIKYILGLLKRSKESYSTLRDRYK